MEQIDYQPKSENKKKSKNIKKKPKSNKKQDMTGVLKDVRAVKLYRFDWEAVEFNTIDQKYSKKFDLDGISLVMDMNPLREEYDKYNKTHTKITAVPYFYFDNVVDKEGFKPFVSIQLFWKGNVVSLIESTPLIARKEYVSKDTLSNILSSFYIRKSLQPKTFCLKVAVDMLDKQLKDRSFLKEIRCCHQNGYYDFKLKCNGKEFDTHKVILASRSSYFQELLQKNPDIKEFFVENTDQNVLGEIISFIYTGKAGKVDCSLMKLVEAAVHFNLKELVEICEVQLVKCVDEENCDSLYKTSVDFGLDQLKLASFQKIQMKFKNLNMNLDESSIEKPDRVMTIIDAQKKLHLLLQELEHEKNNLVQQNVVSSESKLESVQQTLQIPEIKIDLAEPIDQNPDFIIESSETVHPNSEISKTEESPITDQDTDIVTETTETIQQNSETATEANSVVVIESTEIVQKIPEILKKEESDETILGSLDECLKTLSDKKDKSDTLNVSQDSAVNVETPNEVIKEEEHDHFSFEWQEPVQNGSGDFKPTTFEVIVEEYEGDSEDSKQKSNVNVGNVKPKKDDDLPLD